MLFLNIFSIKKRLWYKCFLVNFFKIFKKNYFVKHLRSAGSETHFSIQYIITTQKMKFSVKDFFSKCDQIRMKLRIFFCAVLIGNLYWKLFRNVIKNWAKFWNWKGLHYDAVCSRAKATEAAAGDIL